MYCIYICNAHIRTQIYTFTHTNVHVWTHTDTHTCSRKCSDKLMYFASVNRVPPTPVLPILSDLVHPQKREEEGIGDYCHTILFCPITSLFWLVVSLKSLGSTVCPTSIPPGPPSPYKVTGPPSPYKVTGPPSP